MGIILKDRLEDYPAASREFMRLEERYPDNIYRLDVYYNMYLNIGKISSRQKQYVYQKASFQHILSSGR